MAFVIARSDGVFYAGTRDKQSEWTRFSDDAAEYRKEEEARPRMRGLVKEEKQGRTFSLHEVR